MFLASATDHRADGRYLLGKHTKTTICLTFKTESDEVSIVPTAMQRSSNTPVQKRCNVISSIGVVESFVGCFYSKLLTMLIACLSILSLGSIAISCVQVAVPLFQSFKLVLGVSIIR